jgi:hypothetical protein
MSSFCTSYPRISKRVLCLVSEMASSLLRHYRFGHLISARCEHLLLALESWAQAPEDLVLIDQN